MNELQGTKTICKQFNKLKEAENFQNKLYDQYDFVRLIKSPFFQESGQYWWAVKGRIG